MFATESSGGIGTGSPSSTASAKRAAWIPYWSAGSNVSTSEARATGGSPPDVSVTLVGRSCGMLNGIPTEIRPSSP